MKNIINKCKLNGDGEGIKLRLRGKGSGYKEGPQNKESDEPLHLCISSKNPEEMKKACLLVDELLAKIHHEYKEYCEKGRSDRAYQTIRKQESLWTIHLKERFGKRYIDEISVAEVND